MPRITRITAQKNGERFNIFLDDGNGEFFGFAVDGEVLFARKLKKGLELTEQQIQEIKVSDEIKKAYQASLKFLTYRMRSEKEMHDYLQKKGYSYAVIENVLKKLRYYDFVNDEKFAGEFVQAKKDMSLKGPLLLQQELERKGIAEPIIEQTIQEFSEEEQIEKILALVDKKLSSYQKYSAKQQRLKLVQFLLNKGYSLSTIEKALARRPLGQNEQSEWEALVYQGEKIKRKFSHLPHEEYVWKMKRALYERGFPLPLIERYLSEN